MKVGTVCFASLLACEWVFPIKGTFLAVKDRGGKDQTGAPPETFAANHKCSYCSHCSSHLHDSSNYSSNYYESRVNCTVDAHKIAADLSGRSVLLFGSSLDVFALNYFCESAKAKVIGFARKVWEEMGYHYNVYPASNLAYCDIGGLKLAWSFHPGMSGPPFDPLCKHLLHGLTKNCSDIRSVDLIKRSVASVTEEFGQPPTAIVVDSSLWDVSSWWIQAGRPPEPYVAPVARVNRWCHEDFPTLLHAVQAVAPASKVAFRTAPPIRGDSTTGFGHSKQNIDAMNACLWAGSHSGLKQYEVIDYDGVVNKVIGKQLRRVGMVYEDAIHPGYLPSVLYVDQVLQWLHSLPKSASCHGGWKHGDGTGGQEKPVGDATDAGECLALVRSMCPTANGASFSTKRTRVVQVGDDGSWKIGHGAKFACYCELGMTGHNGNGAWKTCLFAS